jgi:hypothetical protein
MLRLARLRDLSFKLSACMILSELVQRGFVHFLQDLRQFFAVGKVWRKALPIDLSQRDHECVAVLSGDLAISVAMTIVQSRLLHRVLPLKGSLGCNSRGIEGRDTGVGREIRANP